MKRETVTAFLAEEGMTLGMMKQHVDYLLSLGTDERSEIRVRTRIGANKHGAKIKALTVIDNEENGLRNS